ncbi:transposase [Alkalibacillus silvisoli]|uniref:transposase n=1 Tax=Alkalibacillus silvisoli TaxID=392823 RepID=UPI003CD06370
MIAIDDFKGDTDGERFQTIITDPIKREPIDILNGSEALSTIKTDLYDFYDTVRTSAIPEFEKAIETLQNWQKEIMNSFGYNLHNGYIEEINNQTKVIKRQAFGFRRFDRLRRKVLLHHKYKDIQIQMA